LTDAPRDSRASRKRSECNGPRPADQVLTDVIRAAVDAVYLHVPFCFHKCHYCDFYSLVDEAGSPRTSAAAGDRQERFVARIIDEILWLTGEYDNVQATTLFVGGGTPTLLRPALWDRLLSALQDAGWLGGVTEFTVEANPETVTDDLARLLAAGGVNRVSIGAQSFDPAMLKALERWHEPDNVARAADTFRRAGINNVNIDLIFAIPGQTLEMVETDLDAALAIGPDHVSYYSLIFEPNTPLTQRMKMGRVSRVDEDVERAMYERVIERLSAAGFEHYEVSNWSRGPDRHCAHNLAYWHNRNWLGVGPAAASHVAGRRWKNVAHLGQYLASTGQPPTCDHEQLDDDARIGEALMLGLRLIEGVPRNWIDDNVSAADPRRQTIDALVEQHMLEVEDDHLRLTQQGLFIADTVIAELL